jgi:hypothetical protein
MAFTDEWWINALIEEWDIDIYEIESLYNNTFRYDKLNNPDYKLIWEHNLDNSKIIHFVGNSKPRDWKTKNPFLSLWSEYNQRCVLEK